MKLRFDLRFMHLVLSMLAGRRYWVLPLLPLAWSILQLLRLHFGNNVRIEGAGIQGLLIGVPLSALAVYLGARIMAGEIDDRSMEVAYTVPGGVERLWWFKLGACGTVLLVAEALLAAVAVAFFDTYPIGALYGALQSAAFALVLSMALAILFKNEIAGAMIAAAVLAFFGLISGFGDQQVPISPFWNPYAIDDVAQSEVLAQTVQNRIGMLLAIAAIMSLAFMRAGRRERMLER